MWAEWGICNPFFNTASPIIMWFWSIIQPEAQRKPPHSLTYSQHLRWETALEGMWKTPEPLTAQNADENSMRRPLPSEFVVFSSGIFDPDHTTCFCSKCFQNQKSLPQWFGVLACWWPPCQTNRREKEGGEEKVDRGFLVFETVKVGTIWPMVWMWTTYTFALVEVKISFVPVWVLSQDVGYNAESDAFRLLSRVFLI